MTTPALPALDGYEVLAHLGSGGLGDVFRARRVTTGGLVAIKLLRATEHPGDLERRLRRELEAMIELKGHPAVVNVEDVAQSSLGPVLVMEYVSGGSLHQQLRAISRMGTSAVCELGVQVASLLAHAHALGIVHRDIKPQNILITAFGTYKVCDFGIAALTKSADWARQTNSLSYRYASPEEVHGLQVDGSADVYSLGVTLIEARTGDTEGARRVGRLPYDPADQADERLARLLADMVHPEVEHRTGIDLAAREFRHVLGLLDHTPADTAESPTVVRPGAQPNPTTPSGQMHHLPLPTNDDHWWE